MQLRKLLLATVIAAAFGSAHAGGNLNFANAVEWNGSGYVGSDGITENTYGDTDVYQSGVLNVLSPAGLTGNWSFTLAPSGGYTSYFLDSLVYDLDIGGSNPAGVTATIKHGVTTVATSFASRINGNVGLVGVDHYGFDFGNTVFAAATPYTLSLSGFTAANLLALNLGDRGQVGLIATAVPEPESYAMMLAGLSALGFMARRRKAQAK
ncbi:MAG: PEP-CTERM sorting domain-containing protein [Burkholderiales bacterium]